MLSQQERNSIYSEITEIKRQIGEISIQIGRIDSNVSRLRDEISQCRDALRLYSRTSLVYFNISGNVSAYYGDIEGLRNQRIKLLADKNALYQRKEALYARLHGG